MCWTFVLALFSSPPSTALWKTFSFSLQPEWAPDTLSPDTTSPGGFSLLRRDCSCLNSVAMGRSLAHLGLHSLISLTDFFKFPFKIAKIYIDFSALGAEEGGGKRLIMGSEQMNEWIKCTWLSRNRTQWMKPKRTPLFEPRGHLLSYVSP